MTEKESIKDKKLKEWCEHILGIKTSKRLERKNIRTQLCPR